MAIYLTDVKINELEWQKRGLQQTASGYGFRLTTRYKVFYNNKWRRVYAICFSNVASTYVLVKGERVFVDFDPPAEKEKAQKEEQERIRQRAIERGYIKP